MKKLLISLMVLLLSQTFLYAQADKNGKLSVPSNTYSIMSDYSIQLKANYWAKMFSGPFEETSEGLKINTTGYRNGNRVFSKEFFNFSDKDIYIKWIYHNGGRYMRGSIGVTNSGANSGEFSSFPSDQWLYTRIKINSSDKKGIAITCTGDYDNASSPGVVVKQNSYTIADSKWYNVVSGNIFFYFDDTKNREAYLTIGEVRIANSVPLVLQRKKLYDFNDGTIPSEFITKGNWSIDNTKFTGSNSLYIKANADDSLMFSTENANAVRIKYMIMYNGDDSSPLPETATSLHLVGTSWLSVYYAGKTSYASELSEVIIPANQDGRTDYTLKFNSSTNGHELWIKEIEIIAGGGQESTLNGKVTNALDGTAISGALVEIAGLSTTTDDNGNYEIKNIPEATLNAAFTGTPLTGTAPLQVSFIDQSNDAAHSLVVSATGFSTYTNNQVVIVSGETLSMDVSLSPTLATGEMRIVLNWGDAPADLDSYLKTPLIDGNEHTIYWNSKGFATAAPFVTLDHDDTDAFGPETITIYKKSVGTYKYYVYNYSETPDITTSSAVVQVYTDAGLVTSVNVPTAGAGKYWNVLTIDGTTGTVSMVNEIVGDSPTVVPPNMTEKPIVLAKTVALLRGAESVTSWNWSFGDGATSTEKNPTHTYTATGNYTVTLAVSDGTNSKSETKTNYISVIASASGDTIYSTTAGGNWEDTLSWIGHKLPTGDDNVVIQGVVIANAHYGDAFECKSLTLRDSLKCTDDGNYDYVTLTIYEELVNNGTITYDDYGSGFTIFVKGDITNNGIFEPYLLRLDGNSSQTISGIAPIGVHYLEILHGQNIIAGSDLNFVNMSALNVDPYGGRKKHVNFIIDADNTVSFIWEYGEFSTDINKVNFQGGGTIFSSGEVRFIDSTTFSNVKLTGLIQLNDNARILDNVTLLDTLQNASNNYGASIVIEEDFTNNGIVRVNANSNNIFYIYAKKNIVNVGTWKNHNVVMDGTTDQIFTNKGELASSFELKANVNSATTFQWFNDGNAIDGVTSESYTYSFDSNNSANYNPYGEYYCQTNAGNSRKIIIVKGTVDVEDTEVSEIPTEYRLNQNYPNPFNPTTIISYALPKQEMVTINIYNILGERVAELVNEVQNAGNYKVNFDAGNLSTGAYIYRIEAGNFVQIKKMLLIK